MTMLDLDLVPSTSLRCQMFLSGSVPGILLAEAYSRWRGFISTNKFAQWLEAIVERRGWQVSYFTYIPELNRKGPIVFHLLTIFLNVLLFTYAEDAGIGRNV